MIPHVYSDLKIKDIPPQDLYHFSTIQNVDLSDLGDQGLNDLVVELASVLDSEEV